MGEVVLGEVVLGEVVLGEVVLDEVVLDGGVRQLSFQLISRLTLSVGLSVIGPVQDRGFGDSLGTGRR